MRFEEDFVFVAVDGTSLTLRQLATCCSGRVNLGYMPTMDEGRPGDAAQGDVMENDGGRRTGAARTCARRARNGVWRLAASALLGAPLVLSMFLACGGGDSGDVDGGAGSGSDEGGASASGGSKGGSGSGGESGSGGRQGEEGLALADFCDERSSVYFDYLQKCWGDDYYSEERRPEYVGNMVRRCSNTREAVETGRLEYDGERAEGCLASLEELDCAAGPDPAICQGIFAGLSEPGEDCFREETQLFFVGASTCKNGYCAGDSCPGTCEPLPATGEPCEGSCAAEYYCDSKQRCAPIPALGEDCEGICEEGLICISGACALLATNSEDECSEDVHCLTPTVCAHGACRERVELGDPCYFDSHCPSGTVCLNQICATPAEAGEACAVDRNCAPGLFCSTYAEPPVCVPYAPLGEPCGGASGGRCALEHACVIEGDDDEGTCWERVPEGESCAASAQLCDSDLYCSAERICLPPGGEGDTCWDMHPCAAGLSCRCSEDNVEDCQFSDQDDGDTCQPPLDDGEPCFRWGECASGECDLSGSDAPDEPGECVDTVVECLP